MQQGSNEIMDRPIETYFSPMSLKEQAEVQTIRLGHELPKLRGLISDRSNELIKAQASSASAIVVSQNQVRDEIRHLQDGIGDISQGIAGLQQTFEWGLADVLWSIEQSNSHLQKIVKILSAPLTTQARELRSRAIDAFSNGWMEEALSDYNEVIELNRYDFAAHMSIGLIHMFHMPDLEKAAEALDNAVKYSRPKSTKHASYALLHRGLLYANEGDFANAVACAREASELTPNMLEAHYQLGQYLAVKGNTEEASEALMVAVWRSVLYAARAEKDPAYSNVDLESLFANIRDEAWRIVENVLLEFNRLEEKIEKELSSIGVRDLYAVSSQAGPNPKNLMGREGDSLAEALRAKSQILKAIKWLEEYQSAAVSRAIESRSREQSEQAHESRSLKDIGEKRGTLYMAANVIIIPIAFVVLGFVLSFSWALLLVCYALGNAAIHFYFKSSEQRISANANQTKWRLHEADDVATRLEAMEIRESIRSTWKGSLGETLWKKTVRRRKEAT